MAPRKLSLYNKKRDFTRTAEPAGTISRTPTGFSFLVQKHAATRLHYDFRLELDGVLKSWAVTRGPSLDPHDKRLAVEVEDHPVAYGGFEGVIPKGQYGGGTVMMWDEGTWEPLEDPRKGLTQGSLKFRLHGNRLKGDWALVRMKGRPQDRGRNHWLLIKHADRYARPGEGEHYLEKNARSIVSNRSMEAIAAAADRVWKSEPARHSPAISSPPIAAKARAKSPKKAVKSFPLPAFIPPQLATLTTQMPTGTEWVHEVKYDGYRILTYVADGAVRMFTRNGLDWTEKFGNLPVMLAKLKTTQAILDGELVALDKHHVSSFAGLKQALSGAGEGLSYYVFDLLHLNGEDLTSRPLLERKAALQTLLTQQPLGQVFYSEHFAQDARFLANACALRLEGAISKRADAPYHSGRSKTWLKTKCHQRQEFVIGGYAVSITGAPMIGALLLGYYDGQDFVYAGRVGTGFDHATATSLYRTLKKQTRRTMPYTRYSDSGRRGKGWKRGVVWVEPTLVCEVEFTEWTEDGALRHPSFQGMREDKPTHRITRDRPLPTRKAVTAAAREVTHGTAPVSERSATPPPSSGVTLTHPEKILWPEKGYTKQDLMDYYTRIADWILPHIAERPLSFVRCPAGSKKPCFFQRHGGEGVSPHIHELPLYAKEAPYLMIRDLRGLQAMVQMGVLEIHQWGSHAATWDKPDLVVFDFDPDTDLPFRQVKDAAREMHRRLAKLGLKSFLKTTGGKGLHVVVPIVPQHDWATIKQWAKAMAELMAADEPSRYTTNIRKHQRKGRIFIDYLRNGETATAIAPYSTRAREGAPVSVPLAWSELSRLRAGNHWTMATLPTRLARLKSDPWKGFFRVRQTLPLGD